MIKHVIFKIEVHKKSLRYRDYLNLESKNRVFSIDSYLRIKSLFR